MKRMPKTIPLLSKSAVRRARCPYHLAIIEELIEDGFLNSAQLLHSICQIEDSMKIPDDSVQPKLGESCKVIDGLVEALRSAELLQRAGDHVAASQKLYEFANRLSDENFSFNWVSEQVYTVSLQEAWLSVDGGSAESLARLHFCRFLLEKTKDYAKAVIVGGPCWDASKNTDWRLSVHSTRLIRTDAGLVYQQALLKYAGTLKENFVEAMRLGELATKIAESLENNLGLCDCYVHLGVLELNYYQNDTKAFEWLQKAMHHAKLSSSPVKVCEVLFELIAFYSKVKNPTDLKKTACVLKRTAQSNNLQDFAGRALIILARTDIEVQNFESAAARSLKAVEIYKQLGKSDRLDEAKSLVGISKGLSHLRNFEKKQIEIEKKPRGNNMDLLNLYCWADNGSDDVAHILR